MSHPHPKISFVPQAVLTRSGKLSTASAAVNTVRPVNIANTKVVNTARPVNSAASKQTVNHPKPINNTFKRGYSQSSRSFNRYFANKNSITKTNVNTVSVKHTTGRDRAVVRNKGKGANAEINAILMNSKVKQKSDGIFISQDKYVAKILKKFDLASIKTASTPMETNKPLTKDEEAENVDVHLYRSMIGSLMYLTASRPDIMFGVYACARFQVTPKTSHLHAVKKIFRYLKWQPKLGLWYHRDSPFDLEAFSDSDYAGASLDSKSTTGGCQFLGKRLISWQCKKQTIVANSTTEAKYVAAANCCRHVLWIQNQMLDYGYNLMNTNIYIDNKSTICIVKNLVSHSKTKHIEIRYHFIRDSYEKKLIQVIKIHTDKNVADLLTKAFDVNRFNFLIASIGLLNL
ncbi:hypothetical protein Tco_1320726 [Tanacetum coccineum]